MPKNNSRDRINERRRRVAQRERNNTALEQIGKLDTRLGVGVGGLRERGQLHKAIDSHADITRLLVQE